MKRLLTDVQEKVLCRIESSSPSLDMMSIAVYTLDELVSDKCIKIGALPLKNLSFVDSITNEIQICDETCTFLTSHYNTQCMF